MINVLNCCNYNNHGETKKQKSQHNCVHLFNTHARIHTLAYYKASDRICNCFLFLLLGGENSVGPWWQCFELNLSIIASLSQLNCWKFEKLFGEHFPHLFKKKMFLPSNAGNTHDTDKHFNWIFFKRRQPLMLVSSIVVLVDSIE